MLGLNSRATKLAGFVASEEDNPPGSLSISFEHSVLILSAPGFTAVPILNDARKSNNTEILCRSAENASIEFPDLIAPDCDAFIMSDNDRSQISFTMQLLC